MPPTFITDNNVLRLSPLMQAVAASKGATPSTVGDDGADPSGGSAGSPVSQLPPGVDPKQVADAQAKAASGDKDAIDWLKTLGLGAAVVGGGALAAALASRHLGNNVMKDQRGGSSKTGPNSIAGDTTINSKSEVVTAKKKVDLYVDRGPGVGTLNAKGQRLLPAPSVAINGVQSADALPAPMQALTYNPTSPYADANSAQLGTQGDLASYYQNKAVQDAAPQYSDFYAARRAKAAAGGQQFVDFYAARKAKALADAAKNVRRLLP